MSTYSIKSLRAAQRYLKEKFGEITVEANNVADQINQLLRGYESQKTDDLIKGLKKKIDNLHAENNKIQNDFNMALAATEAELVASGKLIEGTLNN